MGALPREPLSRPPRVSRLNLLAGERKRRSFGSIDRGKLRGKKLPGECRKRLPGQDAPWIVASGRRRGENAQELRDPVGVVVNWRQPPRQVQNAPDERAGDDECGNEAAQLVVRSALRG